MSCVIVAINSGNLKSSQTLATIKTRLMPIINHSFVFRYLKILNILYPTLYPSCKFGYLILQSAILLIQLVTIIISNLNVFAVISDTFILGVWFVFSHYFCDPTHYPHKFFRVMFTQLCEKTGHAINKFLFLLC